jgi:hypothetical protein
MAIARVLTGTVALCLLLAASVAPAWAQQAERRDRYLDRPRGPYRGQVVDAETKAPLAGAVVVARWLRDRIHPLHSVAETYAVRETLTDPEGRFVLDARDVEEGAPRQTYHPEFLIFMPGYGSFPRRHVSPKGFTGGIFERTGAVIELPRLVDREQRRRHLLLVSPHSYSEKPFKDLPELMRRINEESNAIGMSPYLPLEK